MTKGSVREHAYRLYRGKLSQHPLTLGNWVLAKKDLVASMQAEKADVEV